MTLEKERSRNTLLLVSGAAAACIGFMIYLIGHTLIGILILIAGISMLMIGWSVSNFFFRMDMKDLFENKGRR